MQEKEIIVNLLKDIKEQLSLLDKFTDKKSYFSEIEIDKAKKSFYNLTCVIESITEYQHSKNNCFTFVMQVIEQKTVDEFYPKGTLSLELSIVDKKYNNFIYKTYFREENKEKFLLKIDEYIFNSEIILEDLPNYYRSLLENYRPDSLDDDTKWI
jgi:hypothetical protein